MSGTHRIEEVPGDGLVLEVDGSPIATIRDRGGNRDLIWNVRGPLNLETSRRAVIGLLDLLVHFDALNMPAVTKGSRSRG